MDGLMLAASGKLTWVPLYLLILWLLYKREGWRNLLLFLGLALFAVLLSDMVAGIFKHNGLLGGLGASIPPRLRPMYTPELEGMIHVIKWGGRYGSVSAHAATTFAVALLSASILRRGWFWGVALCWTLLVCYSRIYLACHFPQDILLGAVLGVASGVCGILLFRWLQQLLARNKKS
jgi:undecaprenyl-diphosphatase